MKIILSKDHLFVSWQSSYFKSEKVINFLSAQTSSLILFFITSSFFQFNYFDHVKPDKKEKVESQRKHKFVSDIEK